MCRCVTSCRWTDVSLFCFKGGIRVWNVDAAGSSITCSKTGVTTTVCLLLCVAVFVQWEHLVARKHLRMFSMLSITLSVASRTATYIFPKTATAGHTESSLCVCVWLLGCTAGWTPAGSGSEAFRFWSQQLKPAAFTKPTEEDESRGMSVEAGRRD